MSAAASSAPLDQQAARGELAAAFAAMRARLGLVALLFALTAVAWWSTVERMAGMEAGPGTDLGALGWFVGVWVVMMAAMMFPSVAPTVALYARMTRRRGLSRSLLFTSAYLLVWAAAGVGAYVCLEKCRSPLGFLLGSWHDGRRGALEMGARHAVWCVGCCWALMAALFALGVMSLVWMALVAALITFEKTLPWRRVATWGTAAILLILAVVLVVAPHAVPGLVVPNGAHNAHTMNTMH